MIHITLCKNLANSILKSTSSQMNWKNIWVFKSLDKDDFKYLNKYLITKRGFYNHGCMSGFETFEDKLPSNGKFYS